MVTNRDRNLFGSRRKIAKFVQTTGKVHVFVPLSGISVLKSRRFPVYKYSRMINPTRSSEMLRCSPIDLNEILRSSKISSWIRSVISGAFTALCLPRRGAEKVEISPHLKWATHFWRWYKKVHLPLMFLSERCEIPWGTCIAGGKNLMKARVSIFEICTPRKI